MATASSATENNQEIQQTSGDIPISVPSYQIQGPNAEYIRKHQFSRITKHYQIENADKFPFHHRLLRNTLEAFLPDNVRSHHHWSSCYATFGLDLYIEKQIMQAYVEHMGLYEHSMRTLREKFTPYLAHYLYKPDGIRFTTIESDFNTAVQAVAHPPPPPAECSKETKSDK